MMTNKGFEVKLNGKLLCKAGLRDNHGVVTCIVDAIFRKQDKAQQLMLMVSGLNSDDNQHVKWSKFENLGLNDTITIKIIEDVFDEPIEKAEKKSDEYLLEQKIKTYYKLKEELKDYIKE